MMVDVLEDSDAEADEDGDALMEGAAHDDGSDGGPKPDETHSST